MSKFLENQRGNDSPAQLCTFNTHHTDDITYTLLKYTRKRKIFFNLGIFAIKYLRDGFL